MKILNFFIGVTWICVISSEVSVPNSTTSIPSLKQIHSTQKKNNKRHIQKRTAIYGYTFFPWIPYNTCIAVICKHILKLI